MTTTLQPEPPGAVRPAVRVRLLGPVGMEIDGRPMAVGGPRAQAVLAVLAVGAGEVVTTDRLIDELWGEHPPRAARVSVQTYLSRLRGSAPPATELLLPRHQHGYLLDPGAAEIDLREFERRSADARAAAAAGRWPDALRSLQEAGRLWHGEPFTGLDEVRVLGVERRRLGDLRWENRLTELHAVLEVRGPAEVVGPLRELVGTHRWDERGWRLLVLALYRAGRQTEALEAVARARRMLVEEQGLEPTPALGRLEQQILLHDPDLTPAAPDRAVPLAPPAVIGRRAELDALVREWDRVCAEGRARLVLVEGEPGVGKSYLVASLAAAVAAAGATVLTGRCFDEPRLPLQPWSDLLPDHPAQWPGPAAPTRSVTAAMIDVWEVAAHRLFAAVADRIGAVAGPVLLVAEDLHWAGVAALRLLEHVLGTLAGRPLLVVATARSTEADMAPPTRGALGELAGRVRPLRLRLGGLDAEAVGALLAASGHPVSPGEAATVCERTGGVPLLALAAVDEGCDVLSGRLGRLGAGARDVAELLAVAGDRQPLSVLTAASRLAEDALAGAFDELVAAGLVESGVGPVPGYSFRHALFRDALDARIGPPRRVALSRRLLAAASLLPGRMLPAAAARHAVAVARSGMPADAARARDECQAAAAAATASHEHHEAAAWLRQAIELCGLAGSNRRGSSQWGAEPGAELEAELEAAYGLAARRAALPDARSAFLRAADLARAAGDTGLLARIGVGWSRGFFSMTGRVDEEFVAVLREALARPEALPAPLRARATAALAAELTWAEDGEERFALADAALADARATGDPATIAEVLRTRHLTVAAADTLDVRRRDTAELLAIVDRLDDVGLKFEAQFHATGPAIDDGDVEQVERLLGAAGRIAETLRQPALEWITGWSRASLLLWQGALEAAEKLAAESADRGAAAGHAAEAQAFLGSQLLEIRRLQGRLGELVPALEAVPLDAPQSPTVARYLCAAGRPDAARARVPARVALRRDMRERPLLDDLAFLAVRLDRPDLRATLRARLEPHADTFGHTVVAHPVGHHWLGVLALADGRAAEAVAHLQRAVGRHAAAGLPLLEAESLIELARARAACGKPSEPARARARELAERHGAPGLVPAVDDGEP